VYILPTRGRRRVRALVVVMLIAGLNYVEQHCVAARLPAAGFGMIAMHLTHRNLSVCIVRTIATSTHSSVSTAIAAHARQPRRLRRASARV
jgi:hypothetical protein